MYVTGRGYHLRDKTKQICNDSCGQR